MNRGRHRALVFFAPVGLVLLAGTQLVGAPAQQRAAAVPGGLLSEDKGKLRVLVDGQPVGAEEFQISRSGNEWVARGSFEAAVPGGGSAKVSGRLRLSPEGMPLHYEYEVSQPGEKKRGGVVSFEGATAKIELRVEGSAISTQDFTFDGPRILVLDNNLNHHYAILARLYDWEKKGPQTFPILLPQYPLPGSVTVEWVSAHASEGVKLDLLRVRSEELELELYLDPAHRLVRIAVPASKAEVIREETP